MASTTFEKPLDNDVSAIRTNLGSPSSASAVTGADAFSKINTLNSNLATYSNADATKVGNYWTSGLIRAHRRGYVVTLKLDNMAINAVSGRTQIATITDGYRPVTEVVFWDDSNSRRYVISTDGSFKAETQSSGNVWGSITYVCNR